MFWQTNNRFRFLDPKNLYSIFIRHCYPRKQILTKKSNFQVLTSKQKMLALLSKIMVLSKVQLRFLGSRNLNQLLVSKKSFSYATQSDWTGAYLHKMSTKKDIHVNNNNDNNSSNNDELYPTVILYVSQYITIWIF